MSDKQTTDMPAGYRILNDGPGREVLCHDDWEYGEVFQTAGDAASRAAELADAGAWGREIWQRVQDKTNGR